MLLPILTFKNWTYKLLFQTLFLGFCFFVFSSPLESQITTEGDILFVAYNADSSDGFAFVTLVEILNTETIYISDNEWNGGLIGSGSFNSNEGAITWINNTGASIAAGTVIIINSSSNDPIASLGIATESDAGFDPGATDEVLYAYLGIDDDTPTLFLSAIANDDFDGTKGTITNTGLSIGVNAIRLDIIDSDSDVAVYNATTVCNTSIDDCQAMIVDITSNWKSDDGTGNQSQDGENAEFPTPSGTGCGVPGNFTGTAFTSCTADIAGRDTSTCRSSTIDLETLLTGTAQGALRYGTTLGIYGDTITELADVTSTTTFYIQDSISTICLDTAWVVITINSTPELSGRDTTICQRDSLDLGTLLENTLIGTLRYGLSFGSYPIAGNVKVSPSSTTSYFLIDSVESTGCLDTTMIEVMVNGPDILSLSPQENLCPAKTVDLSLLSLKDQNGVVGRPQVSYYSSGVESVDSSNKLLSAEVIMSGTYYIRYDIGGCFDTASVIVIMEYCPPPCDIVLTFTDTICNADGRYDLVYSMDTTAVSGTHYIATINGLAIDTILYKPDGSLDTLNDISSVMISDTLIVVDYAPDAGIFISELHYDNVGTDVNEGVEITAPSGTDLSGYTITFYDGGDSMTYGSSLGLSGVIGDNGSGCDAIFIKRAGIQNGPDGIALVNPTGDVIDFISYEGEFLALNGSAKGMTSFDIGVLESNTTPLGQSLQLTDAGWKSATANSYNIVNTGLTCPNIEFCLDTLIYKVPNCPICTVDITGCDTSVCGPSIINLETLLSGMAQGALRYGVTFGVYGDTITNLAEVTETTIFYIQDSISPICVDTTIIYIEIQNCPIPCEIELTFTDTICNSNGTYDLVFSMDTTSVSGTQFIARINTKVIDTLSYKGEVNLDTLMGLSSLSLSDTLIVEDYVLGAGIFISELHYDNSGVDVGEGIEITALKGVDLTGYSIEFYNGSNGMTYGAALPLAGVVGVSGSDCGAIFFKRPGIQNGTDGLALISPIGEVLEFISFEGSFTAINGHANGMTSFDIGVLESSTTPLGQSLQLIDAGWQAPMANSYNVVNTGLTCPNIEFCLDTLIYKVPNCPTCTDDITGRDTSICGSTIVNLETLLSGTAHGALRYGTTFGVYGDTITNLAEVTETTTFYIQDSSSPICIDTTIIVVAIMDCPIPCELALTFNDTICNEDGTYNLVYDLDPVSSRNDQYIIKVNGVSIDTLSYTPSGVLDTLTSLTIYTEADTLIALDYSPDVGVRISELHYDNAGTDTGEGIELTAPIGTDLTGYTVTFYNGGDGMTYGSELVLSGIVGGSGSDCGAMFFDRSGIQNGPDGLALVNASGEVLEFLSYEGEFEAFEGPAIGMISTNIGVSQSTSNALGHSLQLTDAGWQLPIANSYNTINTHLTCLRTDYCVDTLIYLTPLCPVLDLALSKNVIPKADGSSFSVGDTINYLLTIKNQGTAAAYDINIVDSFSSGLIFLTDLNTEWELTTVLETSVALLGIQDSISIPVVFEISSNTALTQILNFAKISSAAITSGGPPAFDIDNLFSFDNQAKAVAEICNHRIIPLPLVQSDFLCFEEFENILIEPLQSPNNIPLYEDFESDGKGIRYVLSDDEFSDGASDFFTRTDGSNTAIDAGDLGNIQGTYWFGASDIDGEGGNGTRTLTFDSADIRGLAQLILSANLAEDDASNGDEDWDDVPSDTDYVLIDYSIDGGAYQPAIHVRPSISGAFNSAPRIDTDYDGIGDGSEISNLFSNYNFAIPQVGKQIVIRITISLDDGDEDIAIDEVKLEGAFVSYNFDIKDSSGGITTIDNVRNIAVTFQEDEFLKNIEVQSNFNGCLSSSVSISLERHDGQESLACYGEVNLYIDENCNISMLAKNAFFTSFLSSEFVNLTFKLENGDILKEEDLSDYIGMKIIFEVQDICTEVYCWGVVNVESKNIPETLIHIDTSYNCNRDIEAISEIDFIAIKDRLDKGCYAQWNNLHYEIENDATDCNSAKIVLNYFAEFTIKDLKSKVLIYQHILSMLAISNDDIYAPGSNNLVSNIALRDTIRILECQSYGTTPEEVARYWAGVIDPEDQAQNGITEGIPFAYPYILMDSTVVRRELLNLVITEELIEDSLVVVDGRWLQLDVIKKDTIIDTIEILNKYPSFMKLENGKTCNIDVKYNDQFVSGSYEKQKVLRSWIILDWCEGSIREMQQWIIKEDLSAPQFNVINIDLQYFTNDSILVNGVLTTADSLEIDIDIDLDLIIQVIDVIEPFVCEAALPIPHFDKLLDDCTVPEDILYSYYIDGHLVSVDLSSGVIEGFPHGVSELLIEAQDECGNSASHKMTIVALDKAPPSLICRDKINVTLIDDYGDLDGGQARVYLKDLDMGSTDACNDIILILGRRLDNKIFCGDSIITFIGSEYLEFCCEDVGLDIPITLTFFDAFGNTAICETEVHVDSKINAKLYIEDDTLSCYEFEDPNFIIYPEVEGVCLDYNRLIYTDDYEYYDSLCGLGTIQRHWYVAGLEDDYYVQLITIKKDSQEIFNPLSIQWPKHYNGERIKEFVVKELDGDRICRLWYNPVHYQDCYEHPTISCLEDDLDIPTWEIPKCGLIQMNYEDQVFEGSTSCKKIIRHWTIIDWCNYKPNLSGYEVMDTIDFIKDLCHGEEYYAYRNLRNKAGIYRFQQEIIVEDAIAPILFCTNRTFGVNEGCKSDIQYSIPIYDEGLCGDGFLDWHGVWYSSRGVVIREEYGSLLPIDSIKLVLADLDLGEYYIDVRLEDACGNKSNCRHIITIIDDSPPIVVCASELTTTIMSDGSGLRIWASDYIVKAIDNCSPVDHYFKENGEYIRSKNISCSNYLAFEGGVLFDTVHSIDEYGNSTKCTIQLNIVDAREVCSADTIGLSINPQIKILKRSDTEVESVSTFEVHQNMPNPFSNATVIPFDLPEAGRVDFTLLDYNGRLILKESGIYKNGRNLIYINPAILNLSSGLFIYELRYAGAGVSTKMLLIR